MFANASDDGIEDGSHQNRARPTEKQPPTHTCGHGMFEEPKAWDSTKEATVWLKTEETNPSYSSSSQKLIQGGGGDLRISYHKDFSSPPKMKSQALWYMPITSALERCRQRDPWGCWTVSLAESASYRLSRDWVSRSTVELN